MKQVKTPLNQPCCYPRIYAFSALTLLGERQERHPACKIWVVRYWCGYLSEVRCKQFAYGPADATTAPSEWFTFLVLAYPGCPGKKPVKRMLLLINAFLNKLE